MPQTERHTIVQANQARTPQTIFALSESPRREHAGEGGELVEALQLLRGPHGGVARGRICGAETICRCTAGDVRYPPEKSTLCRGQGSRALRFTTAARRNVDPSSVSIRRPPELHAGDDPLRLPHGFRFGVVSGPLTYQEPLVIPSDTLYCHHSITPAYRPKASPVVSCDPLQSTAVHNPPQKHGLPEDVALLDQGRLPRNGQEPAVPLGRCSCAERQRGLKPLKTST